MKLLTPLLILASIALEAISALVERHATIVHWHDAHPEFRVFQYGRREKGDRTWEWFFILKTPSYEWGQTDYRRRWCWLRRDLVWTSKSGWFVHLMPARTAEDFQL